MYRLKIMNFSYFKIVAGIILTILSIQVCAQSDAGKAEADSVVVLPDVHPSFPGGPEAWSVFIKQNLDQRVPVIKEAPSGRYKVQVKFIVDKDGAVSNIEALTSHGYGMEQEVIRLIAESDKWVPGWHKGRKVRTRMVQHVTFLVDGGD